MAAATLALASGLGLQLAPAPEKPGSEQRGVLVIGIDPTGRAADLGVEIGDIILEAGGKPMQAPADIGKALDAARGAGHHEPGRRLRSLPSSGSIGSFSP
jgi:serine protease Do